MSGWLIRLAGAGLLIILGMAIGAWTTTNHFRPLLDHQQEHVAQCAAARDNLIGLVEEQGKALGDLKQAEQKRQAEAEHAVTEAKASAQADYAAANRLQQERMGGDQCAAASSVIDQELGL